MTDPLDKLVNGVCGPPHNHPEDTPLCTYCARRRTARHAANAALEMAAEVAEKRGAGTSKEERRVECNFIARTIRALKTTDPAGPGTEGE